MRREQALYVEKRLREKRATAAAKIVRDDLLASITEDRFHLLQPDTIADARRAKPYGEFPSHTTLIFMFEHELWAIPAGNSETD